MDLSIITVTWNSSKQIKEQISSVISGCKNISFEIIVVDNNSSDDTCEIISNLFPNIILIKNNENVGFGKANNQGFNVARGEFVLFLNPDMRVEEGSLDILVDWMKKQTEVGIASPKLVDSRGIFNIEAGPRRFPKVFEQVLMLLKIHHLFLSILDDYLMKDFDCEKEQEVDSVRGSFMLMRRTFIEKLGWAFDPRYFIWFEDVDICKEAKKHGYKVMYTPIVSCVDYVGQSFKKRSSLWKQKNFTKSMLVYFKKWEPWWKWIWIAMFRPVGIGLVWLDNFVMEKSNLSKKALKKSI